LFNSKVEKEDSGVDSLA